MSHSSHNEPAHIIPSQVIFQTKDIDRKIYVKEQRGEYQRMRRFISWGLMLCFILLPFVQYEGSQAVLFDLAMQKLRFFAWNFYPQDLMIFVFVFIFAAFLLFYISNRYGRVWCGFVCPQTVWTLLFMWAENRIEGNVQQRRRLDASNWTWTKAVKKTTKHTLWLVIATLTALAFMAYFVPAKALYLSFFSFDMSAMIMGWVFTFMLCTYLNAGLVREKMCQHMCPYASFQSAMINTQTKLVTYDAKRGENRGPRKRRQAAPSHLGDCVDCQLCVHVCPVGIDIRDGMQYDCINCGLCIDACDDTMKTFGYALGLIRFQSETKQATSPLKNYAYVLLMALTLLATLIWMEQRDLFEMTVIKDRNVLYRYNEVGLVENAYQIELLNKTNEQKRVVIELTQASDFQIEPATPILIAPNEMLSRVITISAPESHNHQFYKLELKLVDENRQLMATRTAKFHMPR